MTHTSSVQSSKYPTTVGAMDLVYHCAPIQPLQKDRFRDARARGNEGDRLFRPAELLSAEQRADTDKDVHPSRSLLRAHGQATVSVMPIPTLEENALTLQISTFLVATGLGLTNCLLGRSLKVRNFTGNLCLFRCEPLPPLAWCQLPALPEDTTSNSDTHLEKGTQKNFPNNAAAAAAAACRSFL